MAGGDKSGISTCHYNAVNELLGILSEENSAFYWTWAQRQILKIAQEIRGSAGRREILEAVLGLYDFTSFEHFEVLGRELAFIIKE